MYFAIKNFVSRIEKIICAAASVIFTICNCILSGRQSEFGGTTALAPARCGRCRAWGMMLRS
jgi:hypothetical protein